MQCHTVQYKYEPEREGLVNKYEDSSMGTYLKFPENKFFKNYQLLDWWKITLFNFENTKNLKNYNYVH